MIFWTCPNCGQSVPESWKVCSSCGHDADASNAEASPATEPDAFPPHACLRCGKRMRSTGAIRLHEGTRAWPFLFGELGELLVNRERFEVFACEGCGKVEFFLPTESRTAP